MTAAMVGEALALATAGRLDRQAVLEIMANSAVGSPLVNYKQRALRDRDFTPAFSGAQMAKDFDLVLGAARALAVPMPMASMVRELWSAMKANGLGEQDFFACTELQARAAGPMPQERSSK
jgi:3-hydroxyisobutyrate dehydrogenase-like beta-hydroxyacid dehydrogenase